MDKPVKKPRKKSKDDLAMDAAMKKRGLLFVDWKKNVTKRGKADANLATRMKCYNIENSY